MTQIAVAVWGLLRHDQAHQFSLGVYPILCSKESAPGKGPFVTDIAGCRLSARDSKAQPKVVLAIIEKRQLRTRHQFYGPCPQYPHPIVYAAIQSVCKKIA